MMKAWFRKIAQPVMAPLIFRLLNRNMSYSYEGIDITIFREVFHPQYFYSTKLLLQFLKKQSLQGKTLLELGAGSGIVSFYAEQLGAKVTATDIANKVIEGLTINKQKLSSHIEIVSSDLFANLEIQAFDYIMINPPYFAKNPTNEQEMAWYCGEHFEYFERLFSELKDYVHELSMVMMVLSEDCNIAHLKTMAAKNHLSLALAETHRGKTETNYIFRLKTV